MVNTSKVLTVSYGTFSCTLEGFDDSFDTMKAIAEYFRDLAADDRYFGAEPPTPDADMLARIAEREIARRVEAHHDGSNIILRTALPAADVPQDDSQAVTEDAEETEAPAVVSDKIAARQARREAAAKAEAEAEAEAIAKAEADAKADIEAKRAADLEAEKLIQQEAERVAQEARVQEAADEAAEAEKLAKEEAAKKAEETQKSDSDSIADKLARIRAVVGQPKPTESPDYSEDEHADDIMQGTPGDTDLDDLVDMDDDDGDDTIAGVMSRLSGAAPDAVETVDETVDEPQKTDSTPEQADEALQEPPAPQPAAPLRARVIKMKRAEFEAALASGDIESVEDDANAVAETAEAPADDSALSDDDEAELQRELAAVEAELAGLDDDFAEEDEPEVSYGDEDAYEDSAEPANQRGADDLSDAPEEALDRLMAQTGTELEEPDGKKRRNAMGHLRAAVASARAEKAVAPNAAPVDETEAYRGDLQSAVRPRRPVRRLSAQDAAPSDAQDSAQPAARAPLKLVAEQRVDSPAPSAAPVAPQPVRPRRVRAEERPEQAAQDTVDTEAGSFAEFAEEMGATELPDLLEAAAAYLAYVEGKDQFSRPQVMTKVRMVQEENYSREDGLRSFGQLLRQGKIEKISGGRFTVSDRISFKPDTRAAG